MELGVGVPSRATDGAREEAIRDGVAGTTELARESEGGFAGSGGVGGSIAHPKRAVKTDVSEGSTRGNEVAEENEGISSVGVVGSKRSRMEDDGNETEDMIEVND